MAGSQKAALLIKSRVFEGNLQFAPDSEGVGSFIRGADVELNTISIVGAPKSGKSLLLNSILGVEEAFKVRAANEGTPASPVVTTSSLVDLGIVASRAAFEARTIKGPVLSLIEIMRCENMTAIPIVLTSKIIIVNVLHNDQLLTQTFSYLSNLLAAANFLCPSHDFSKHKFGEVRVVIRDYNASIPLPKIESLLWSEESSDSDEVLKRNAIRHQLRDAFSSVSVHTLSRPVDASTVGPSLRVSDCTPKFRESVQAFVRSFVRSLMTPTVVDKRNLTCLRMVAYISQCVTRMNSPLGSISFAVRDLTNAMEIGRSEIALRKAYQSLEKNFVEVLKSRLPCSDADMKEVLDQALPIAVDVLTKTCGDVRIELLEEAKKNLSTHAQNELQKIVSLNEEEAKRAFGLKHEEAMTAYKERMATRFARLPVPDEAIPQRHTKIVEEVHRFISSHAFNSCLNPEQRTQLVSSIDHEMEAGLQRLIHDNAFAKTAKDQALVTNMQEQLSKFRTFATNLRTRCAVISKSVMSRCLSDKLHSVLVDFNAKIPQGPPADAVTACRSELMKNMQDLRKEMEAENEAAVNDLAGREAEAVRALLNRALTEIEPRLPQPEQVIEDIRSFLSAECLAIASNGPNSHVLTAEWFTSTRETLQTLSREYVETRIKPLNQKRSELFGLQLSMRVDEVINGQLSNECVREVLNNTIASLGISGAGNSWQGLMDGLAKASEQTAAAITSSLIPSLSNVRPQPITVSESSLQRLLTQKINLYLKSAAAPAEAYTPRTISVSVAVTSIVARYIALKRDTKAIPLPPSPGEINLRDTISLSTSFAQLESLAPTAAAIDSLLSSLVEVRCPIPSSSTPRIIGKGGATIKSIRESTGAQIDIIDAEGQQHSDDQILCILGTRSEVESACKLIEEKIQSPSSSDNLSITLYLPESSHLVFPNTNVLPEVAKKTGASIDLPSRGSRRYIHLSGSPSAIRAACAALDTYLTQYGRKRSITFQVEKPLVGRILGPQSGNITGIEKTSGALISHQQDGVFTIVADTNEKILSAAELLDKLIQKSCLTIKKKFPAECIGILIGAKGSRRRAIQDESGAQFDKDDQDVFTIQASDMDSIQAAASFADEAILTSPFAQDSMPTCLYGYVKSKLQILSSLSPSPVSEAKKQLSFYDSPSAPPATQFPLLAQQFEPYFKLSNLSKLLSSASMSDRISPVLAIHLSQLERARITSIFADKVKALQTPHLQELSHNSELIFKSRLSRTKSDSQRRIEHLFRVLAQSDMKSVSALAAAVMESMSSVFPSASQEEELEDGELDESSDSLLNASSNSLASLLKSSPNAAYDKCAAFMKRIGAELLRGLPSSSPAFDILTTAWAQSSITARTAGDRARSWLSAFDALREMKHSEPLAAPVQIDEEELSSLESRIVDVVMRDHFGAGTCKGVPVPTAQLEASVRGEVEEAVHSEFGVIDSRLRLELSREASRIADIDDSLLSKAMDAKAQVSSSSLRFNQPRRNNNGPKASSSSAQPTKRTPASAPAATPAPAASSSSSSSVDASSHPLTGIPIKHRKPRT